MTFEVFTSRDYLLIDAASAYGLDRVNWNERISFMRENLPNFRNMIHDAKEPALFFAACEAIEAVDAGDPTGHMISLDATASGIQILSIMTGDLKAARHCNVVDTGTRQDAYTNIHNLMLEHNPNILVERKDAKRAVMTVFYGSENVPKEVFGNGPELLLFEQVTSTEMPAVWSLNKAFLQMWDSTTTQYNWVMPDNFHVNIDVTGKQYHQFKFMGRTYEASNEVIQAQPRGRAIGANVTHSVDGFIVREIVARCSYDPGVLAQVKEALVSGTGMDSKSKKGQMVLELLRLWEHSNFLSARILDYLDANNVALLNHTQRQAVLTMIATMPNRPFTVLTNHDCFRVHPNYGNEVRRQYNIMLAKLNESNMLPYICGQILKRPVKLGRLNAIPSADILESNYALS